MAIHLTCACGRNLKIKDEFAGQEGQCPACGATLMIPYPDNAAETVEVAEAIPTRAPARPAPEPDQFSDQEVRQIPQRRDRRDDDEEELRNHGGDPLPVNGDYFVEAPAEIGPLTSAYTTLRRGQRPWSLAARLVLCTAATVGGLFIGAGIDLIFDLFPDFWFFVWPILGPLVGFLIAFFMTRFQHTLSYVGEEGVARYVCSGSRDNVTTKEIFCFRDATHLRITTTHHYNRGAYQHTSYNFVWTDVGGRKRYEITGTHNSKNKMPPTKHAFHFARAAELAWTIFLLEDSRRKLETAGGVSFPLKGRQSIRICPGRIIFHMKEEEPIEWEADEVGDAVIQQGTVKIKRVDAKEGWFSSTGVVKFPFNNLANAQLFFHLLDKVIGVEAR